MVNMEFSNANKAAHFAITTQKNRFNFVKIDGKLLMSSMVN